MPARPDPAASRPCRYTWPAIAGTHRDSTTAHREHLRDWFWQRSAPLHSVAEQPDHRQRLAPSTTLPVRKIATSRSSPPGAWSPRSSNRPTGRLEGLFAPLGNEPVETQWRCPSPTAPIDRDGGTTSARYSQRAWIAFKPACTSVSATRLLRSQGLPAEATPDPHPSFPGPPGQSLHHGQRGVALSTRHRVRVDAVHAAGTAGPRIPQCPSTSWWVAKRTP